MRWHDRVYGDVAIEEPGILDLIGCPTFQRLKGVRQAGPSALAFPFKNVTRFEHSLGVFLLLRRLDADPREQVAGLLHDVSHTAFSHAVDFVISSREQDHHEQLKPMMLDRPDIVAALGRLGYSPRDFYDDSIYPLLEQPLPSLCADRLDYFLRDGLACGVVTLEAAARILGHLAVWNDRIILTDIDVAREAVSLFKSMNQDWWASPTEAFIYNEFADALREGLRLGILQPGRLDDRGRSRPGQARRGRQPGHHPDARPDPALSPRTGRGIHPSDRAQGTLARPSCKVGSIRRTTIDSRRSGFPA